MLVLMLCFFVYSRGDLLDLHVLAPAFPTRRAAGRVAGRAPWSDTLPRGHALFGGIVFWIVATWAHGARDQPWRHAPRQPLCRRGRNAGFRSEEHTSELQ